VLTAPPLDLTREPLTPVDAGADGCAVIAVVDVLGATALFPELEPVATALDEPDEPAFLNSRSANLLGCRLVEK
jgi:hypothetical protein